MSIKETIGSILTRVSPTLNTKVLYYYKYGRRINLKNPREFHEKLLWLKLYRYNHDPAVKQCADKYRVRDYVIEKTGGVRSMSSMVYIIPLRRLIGMCCLILLQSNPILDAAATS